MARRRAWIAAVVVDAGASRIEVPAPKQLRAGDVLVVIAECVSSASDGSAAIRYVVGER